MIIEAHRGASAEAPENTLAAFRRAIEVGADSIELDTHACADGELVVIHDHTLERTTNGVGAVSETSLSDLGLLDAGGKFNLGGFPGEPIPTLAQVFELLADTDLRLNIEIKQPSPGMRTVDTIVALLDRFGKRRRYIVSSFNRDILLELRQAAPDVASALLGDAEEAISGAIRHKFLWAHCQEATMTCPLMERAASAGLKVGIWTTNTPSSARQWVAKGVQNIITNDPRAMVNEFRPRNAPCA